MAALLQQARKEAEQANELDVFAEDKFEKVSVTPKTPPANLSVGAVASSSGHPPEGGPRDLGGANPSGSDPPPLWTPPGWGP